MKPGQAITHGYKDCTLVWVERDDGSYRFIVGPGGDIEHVEKSPDGQYVTHRIYVKDQYPIRLLQRYGDKLDTLRCQSGIQRAIQVVEGELSVCLPSHAAGLERAKKELKKLEEKMH